MSYVYDTDGSLPDGKVDGVVTTTPSNKRAKATEWNSLCHAIADLRTALLAISPAAGEVDADTITPPISGGGGGGDLDLSEPVVSTLNAPGGAAQNVRRANFDVSSNPAQSSPALANFAKPLELGGNYYSAIDDEDACIYLGALCAKLAGSIVRVLNNYGQGGQEVTVFDMQANGDAKAGGALYVGQLDAGRGRIIADAGRLYLMSLGALLNWNTANDGSAAAEWYKGASPVLVASLSGAGNLSIGARLTLDGGPGKTSGSFKADVDANFIYVDNNFRTIGNIYADGSITAQTSLATPAITSPVALTVSPGTTFAVHGQNFDVDTAGQVIATGKVLAAGGIGVGNSASASTPGTVVKKMEVFDAAGNSIGFVPIYDTIS